MGGIVGHTEASQENLGFRESRHVLNAIAVPLSERLGQKFKLLRRWHKVVQSYADDFIQVAIESQFQPPMQFIGSCLVVQSL